MQKSNLLKFLFGATTVLYIQFIQSFLIHRGFNPLYLGYVYGATCILDILISIPTGALADRFGVKQISILGVIALIFASALSVVTTGWPLLLLGYGVYKIAESTLNGVISVWARNLPANSTASAGSIFTRLDQWQRIGMITMAIIVGFLIKDSGFSSRSGWLISFITTFVFLGVALQTPSIKTHVGSKSIQSVIKNVVNSFSGSATLRTAVFAIFVLGLAEGLVGAKYWVWIKEIGITGPLAISIIVVLSSVSRVAGQFFFASAISNERKRFLFSLIAISIISFVFSTPLPAMLLVTVWFVRIFCYASYFPLLNKELEEVSDKSIHGTVLSAAPTINGIGAAIGSIACSHFQVNTEISFLLIGIFCSGSAMLWVRALKAPSKIENIGALKAV